jgi:hypothetical protein
MSFTVKSVDTALMWEYAAVPTSRRQCCLCTVDVVETGRAAEPGAVQVHSCGAVVHAACGSRLPEKALCPTCNGPWTDVTALNLFTS